MNLNKMLPENIKSLKAYEAGRTIEEVQQLYNPVKISKLASNENRFGCSPLVYNSVIESLNEIQEYPDPYSGRLRKEIAKLNNVDEEEILIAAGSESIISIICRTFYNENEHAITANATFAGFFVQAGVKNIPVKKIAVTHDFRFDVDAILDSIESNTKMVYIANPNNPTGTYINKFEYEQLINSIPENVLLIVDEAYFEFAESTKDYPDARDYRKDNIIILRTFSKAYGLAGFRIGFALANQDLIQEMIKTKLTFEPTAPAQAAAIAAIQDQEFIKNIVQNVEAGRERLYSFFRKYGVRFAPSNANFVMMILENEQDAIQFTDNMLKKGVIIRRVQAFGLPNCVRITIGTPDEMEHFEKSFLQLSEGQNTQEMNREI